MTYLPDEILYMVCIELWHQRDFNTLRNCACSGKQLASIALRNLYRTHDVAPVMIAGRADEDERLNTWMCYSLGSRQEERTQKWAALWRAIILSSLGQTLYPYSQYLRALNLRDLEELLTSRVFKTRVGKRFFQGELAQFKVNSQVEQVGLVETIGRIGEAVTQQTPLLEELTGRVYSDELSRWIPRLPRLTCLTPWHTAAIDGNGNLIRLHCPLFKRLNFYNWDIGNYCPVLGPFLNQLNPQSLASFEALSNIDLGPESLQALSCHGESLIELKLHMEWSGFLPEISLLKGYTNLVSLSLTADFQCTHDLKRSLDTIAWLKECKRLRILAFSKYFPYLPLTAPILLEDGIHLTSFEYKGLYHTRYESFEDKIFHQGLANQTSLQSLWLDTTIGYGGNHSMEAEILVEALSKLVNLTDLRLKEISKCFADRHIVQLASSLPKLEVLSTGGGRVTDSIWDEIASLRSLRRLDMYASTIFTASGILDFIEKLGPGNEGFVLSVLNSEKDGDLSRVDQKLIRKKIATKVKGRFKFRLCEDCQPVESEEETSLESESD